MTKKVVKKSSAMRSDKQPSTSDLRRSAIGLRRKGRPRGRPFEKGNSYGVRFVKGQSGNPGGCPKYSKISEAARAALALDPTEKVKPSTNAEALVLSAINRAKRGHIGAFGAIADRAEGRPATMLELQDASKGDPIAHMIVEMHQIGARLYGRPEGMPVRHETTQENDDEEN